MPEYKAPGVYVEEVERGPRPIEGVSTSVAGFLGPTERGPIEPQLVTSIADFQRTFGGFDQYRSGGWLEGTYLAYAVDGFFRNGGNRCYVGRVVEQDAVGNDDYVATTEFQDDGTTVMTARAVGPGEWGHNVAIVAENAAQWVENENDLFKLTIKYWSRDDDVPRPADPDNPTAEEVKAVLDADADVEEVYDNLSPSQSASDFYEQQVNNASNLVDLTREADGRPIVGTGETPEITFLAEPTEDLTQPKDLDVTAYNGNDEKGSRSGLAAFAEVDAISILCAPDAVTVGGLRAALVEHCEDDDLQDRMAVLQGAQNFNIDDPDVENRSSYAALYVPWIKIRDPVTDRLKEIPPGGHVAGIYARSDAQRGVHKAPANEQVRGVEALQHSITQAEQESLNPIGVNCIRTFRTRGTRVWGARTTSTNSQWKYVNVRRLFLYLRESIDEGTQWVVFEPNDEELWARVRQSVSNFLQSVWEDGALMGSTPEEAYYVKCDRSTMTQNDIDNGRLICEIGVAPVKPAEFVVFRISQWTGGGE